MFGVSAVVVGVLFGWLLFSDAEWLRVPRFVAWLILAGGAGALFDWLVSRIRMQR